MTKLFPLKFNLSNQVRHPRASGIWLSLQKLISSSVKQEKLGKEGNTQLEKSSRALGLLNALEQPQSFKDLRAVRPDISLGMHIRFSQFFKFKKTSSLRIPIDESICTSFTHP
jgi:hypothetical protein